MCRAGVSPTSRLKTRAKQGSVLLDAEASSAHQRRWADRNGFVRADRIIIPGSAPCTSMKGAIEVLTDNEVEASRELLQRSFLLGIVDEMRSKLERLGFLAVAGGEGVNLTAPFVRELQGHVAQAADPNDANPRGGPDLVYDEGREHGDPAAQQRSRFGHVESLGNRANPRPLSAHTVGETAVTSEYCALDKRTQMMIPGQALMA